MFSILYVSFSHVFDCEDAGWTLDVIKIKDMRGVYNTLIISELSTYYSEGKSVQYNKASSTLY